MRIGESDALYEQSNRVLNCLLWMYILLPVKYVCMELFDCPHNVSACLLTFPRSCSCSCCRLWTPGWPAESSCSSSPPPGPSLYSSGSCCVTSYLLLLSTEANTQRKREGERESDRDRKSMTLNHFVTHTASCIHMDYYRHTCAFTGS